MKSMTKNRLAEHAVKEIVAQQFPGETIREMRELENGMFNASYLIRGDGALRDGAVLKTGPAPGTRLLTYEQELMKTEVRVYALLSDQALPLPRVLASDFSKRIIDADYFLMSRAEGTLWRGGTANKRLVRKSRPQLLKELGGYNARMHKVRGDWFGYIKDDRTFQFDHWYDAFLAMMGQILADGQRENCRLPYADIEAAVRRNERFLHDVTEPRLVNFDLHAGNVFLQESGGAYTISGIIDFERAFFGDPYADFIASMMIYSDIEAEPAFQNGYNAHADVKLRFGKSERRRMDLYRLYLAVIMHVETYRFGKLYARVLQSYTKSQIAKLLKRL